MTPFPISRDPIALRIEKTGRGGKTVTIVSRLAMHPAGKEELLRRFKTACGAGGTIKNGEIEIQGDQRARLKGLLEGMGFQTRSA